VCGIAGHFGRRKPTESAISRTLEEMHRRGPDSRDTATIPVTGDVAMTFLFSRLSIIDLNERADQPFRHGDLTVSFNGEIYNYIEVRKELESKGRKFTTSSDTEVLIQAFSEWGWKAVDRLEGQWAFAMYDARERSLYLCRDRFGEKPLYYHLADNGDLYFGSEVKNLKSLSGARLPINENHLKRFLVNGYKGMYKAGEEFFLGVRQVPSGSFVRIGADLRVQAWKFWEPKGVVPTEMSFEDAVKGVRERLIRAVELRLRADVPLAFCMSGGVDSNSLISIAKRVLNYDVHGFTIANTDSRYDEQETIEGVVSELGLRHTKILLNREGFLDGLRELVRYHDAPVYTVTYYVHWLLQKGMHEHGYKISLSGTAADELFTGYFDHHLAYFQSIRNDRDLLDRSIAAWEKKIKPIVRNPFLSNPRYLIDDPFSRDHIFLNHDEFSDCLVTPWSEPFMEMMYTKDLLRNRMLNELFYEATPVILHEDDLNAMYYSIENRSPFLDRELFSFSQSIPTRHLIRDGTAKAVLRESMRGIVPNIVLDNPRKVGFNAPIMDLIDLRDPAVQKVLLADSPIFDLLQRSKVEKMLGRDAVPNSISKFLFNFLSVKMFLEECAG
jgi:asparagine synthase (glutamine-hydrolysing)